MSIAKTKQALDFYGYTLTAKENEIIKVKDRTKYPKLIWEHYYDMEDVLIALEKGKLIEDDVIFDTEIEITNIIKTFKNTEFWSKHTALQSLTQILENDPHPEDTITTLEPHTKQLIQLNFATEHSATESDKIEYLESLKVKQLADLAKSIGLKSAGIKSELIDRIAPEIETTSLPSKVTYNPEFFKELEKIKTIYVNEAAKTLSSLPITDEAKSDIISDGLHPLNYDLSKIEEIIQKQNTPYQPPERIQKRPLEASEKDAIGSIFFGIAIMAGFYYLLPNFSWWVYLIVFLFSMGTYYGQATQIHANENLSDKNIK